MQIQITQKESQAFFAFRKYGDLQPKVKSTEKPKSFSIFLIQKTALPIVIYSGSYTHLLRHKSTEFQTAAHTIAWQRFYNGFIQRFSL